MTSQMRLIPLFDILLSIRVIQIDPTLVAHSYRSRILQLLFASVPIEILSGLDSILRNAPSFNVLAVYILDFAILALNQHFSTSFSR